MDTENMTPRRFLSDESPSPLDSGRKIPYNNQAASGCSAVGSALGSGPRGRGFKSRHSDQTMIIRTTLSKWVMCSDLSFLLRMFFNSSRVAQLSAALDLFPKFCYIFT